MNKKIALLAVPLVIMLAACSAEPTPAVTVTAAPATTEVAPQACLDVITAADNIIDGLVNLGTLAAGYPPMIGEAAEAGMNMDTAALDDLISRMKDMQSQLDDIEPTVAPLREAYDTAVADCKAAA